MRPCAIRASCSRASADPRLLEHVVGDGVGAACPRGSDRRPSRARSRRRRCSRARRRRTSCVATPARCAASVHSASCSTWRRRLVAICRPGIAVPHGAPQPSDELRVARVPAVHLDEQLTARRCRWSRTSRRLRSARPSARAVPTASPSSARLARTRLSGGKPACDPIDEEDRPRRRAHRPTRPRARPTASSRPSTIARERPDDDHRASEPAHRPREVGTRHGDHCRRRPRCAAAGKVGSPAVNSAPRSAHSPSTTRATISLTPITSTTATTSVRPSARRFVANATTIERERSGSP